VEPVSNHGSEAERSDLPPVSSMSKVGMVFSDPYRLGSYVLSNPMWWLPFVITAIFAVSFTTIGQKQMLAMTQQKVEKQFAKSNADLPAEHRQQAIDMALSVTKVTAPIFAILSSLAMSALGGVLLLFVCNLLMGGTVKFKFLFAGIMWIQLIGSLGVVVKLPMMLIRDTFDIPIGPAVLLPEGSEGFLYTFLNGLDLFMIWEIIAGGLLVSALYNWSKGKGVTVMVSMYLILLIGMAGLSTLGGGSGGVHVQVH
jgi:hypothetical protein